MTEPTDKEKIVITVSKEIFDDFHENLLGFIEDFYGDEKDKIELTVLETPATEQ